MIPGNEYCTGCTIHENEKYCNSECNTDIMDYEIHLEEAVKNQDWAVAHALRLAIYGSTPPVKYDCCPSYSQKQSMKHNELIEILRMKLKSGESPKQLGEFYILYNLT
jgi:hypothetical protein